MASFDPQAEDTLKLEIMRQFNDEMASQVEEERWLPESNFYDWKEVYPVELKKINDNIEVIAAEALQVAQRPWIPWPEDALNSGSAGDWTVYPFLRTFPALDESRSAWISSTSTFCPKTVELLKTIPNLKTALFSRMAGNTALTPHTGWCDLANYVLRVHVCLHIPAEPECCGLCVEDEVEFHEPGKILVFGDSKCHKAFNSSDKERIVLILDILRPIDIALGTCVGGHTSDLDGLISSFA